MESSIQTMARPVIDRLPNVNHLDEFACRQLDRFGRYSRPSEEYTRDDLHNDDRTQSFSRSVPARDHSMTREDDASANIGRVRQVSSRRQGT
jgi:Transcription factor Opi1